MDRKVLALSIILVITVGVGVAYFYGKSDSNEVPVNYKAKILSKLGAMDCYTYEESINIVRGNVSINSTIEGGYYNGTYFFHGKKEGVEWWTVVTGGTLLQRIIVNGSERIVTMNISDAERSMLTSYDPVKFALRAVGAGMELGGDELSRTYRYTMRLYPGKDDTLISGNVTVVMDQDFNPVKIKTVGTVMPPSGKSEIRKITSEISENCRTPGWVVELVKKAGQ